jgi:hypothetical protein
MPRGFLLATRTRAPHLQTLRAMGVGVLTAEPEERKSWRGGGWEPVGPTRWVHASPQRREPERRGPHPGSQWLSYPKP